MCQVLLSLNRGLVVCVELSENPRTPVCGKGWSSHRTLEDLHEVLDCEPLSTHVVVGVMYAGLKSCYKSCRESTKGYGRAREAWEML